MAKKKQINRELNYGFVKDRFDENNVVYNDGGMNRTDGGNPIHELLEELVDQGKIQKHRVYDVKIKIEITDTGKDLQY